MINLYRLVGAFMTWASILVQYAVLLRLGTFGGFGATTLAYLGYFTILTNILVGLAFIAPLLRLESPLRRFFTRQAVRAAIALYIFVVMIVYWAVLSAIHEREGLGAVANVGLHLVVPIMYLVDWIIFAPKRDMRFSRLPLWVVFPFLYGIYTLIRGKVTGVYPYPFLDLDTLGLGQVAVNMMGFTLFYFIGGAVFIVLGRVLPREMNL